MKAVLAPVVLGVFAVGSTVVLPANLPSDAGRASRIIITKINVDLDVKVGRFENGTWDLTSLRSQAAHLQGTADVGRGNTVIGAHRTLPDTGDPGPFYDLPLLSPGDVIVVCTSEVHEFAVYDHEVVAITDVRVVAPTETPRLTLITCHGSRRYVVYAKEVKHGLGGGYGLGYTYSYTDPRYTKCPGQLS